MDGVWTRDHLKYVNQDPGIVSGKTTQPRAAKLLEISIDNFLELFFSKDYKGLAAPPSVEVAEHDYQEAPKLE